MSRINHVPIRRVEGARPHNDNIDRGTWHGADTRTNEIGVNSWVALKDVWVTKDGYTVPDGRVLQVSAIDRDKRTVTLVDTMRRTVGTIAIEKVRAA